MILWAIISFNVPVRGFSGSQRLVFTSCFFNKELTDNFIFEGAIMRKGYPFIISVVILMSILCGAVLGQKEFFAGQDLRVSGEKMYTYSEQSSDGADHVLLFENDFEMSIGNNHLEADSGVVWIKAKKLESRGTVAMEYNTQVYLEGDVSLRQGRGHKTTGISTTVLEKGESMAARFLVTGQVLASADERDEISGPDLESKGIYQNALGVLKPVKMQPVMGEYAMVPSVEEGLAAMGTKYDGKYRPGRGFYGEKAGEVEGYAGVEARPGEKWARTDLMGLPQDPVEKTASEAQAAESERVEEFRYPINIAGLWDPEPVIERTRLEDGSYVATVTGRFYLWQKLNEEGDIIEFQADNAVIYYSEDSLEMEEEGVAGDTLASGEVESVYLRGGIIITEAERTVRADEAYYDFRNKKALAVNAEMRSYDEKRQIPIYLRAHEIRQVADNIFTADDITLTTSEFYVPQVSMTASSIVVTDLTAIERRKGLIEEDDTSYDAVMKDTRLKFEDTSVFYWPKIRTDLERPDIPMRSLRIGDDGEMGMTVESRWHLSRMLGRKEPEGVDSTLAVDYFGKRGFGTGAEIEYEREDYYGLIDSYVMQDRLQEDDLGRINSRQDVKVNEDYRGRFFFRHRHYLPYDWQISLEASWASDRNFIEWFYPKEFDLEKKDETVVHLKRIWDIYGFSLLGKFHINDHLTETEEHPTAEFHVKGLSFWDNKLTYYSDTQISRLRERIADGVDSPISEKYHTFITSRHEVDMPFSVGTWKVVPFVAGSYGFEDQTLSGFNTDIDGDRVNAEKDVTLAEFGVRAATMFQKTDKSVRSKFWDLDGMRHIIKPHTEIVMYADSDETVEMRDVLNAGVSQRWQTHRGKGNNRRLVDWMRLDTDITWVDESWGDSAGPALFIWNNPAVPFKMRRTASDFGVLRNSVTADYEWKVSNMMTILSDLNYDIQSGSVQQFNAGVARHVFPDLSYYIGSRYLKRVEVSVPQDNIYEQGSHSVVAAATYSISPRYTLTMSQEYNFDYGENVGTEVTLIRRYHRMLYGLTFSRDDSRDEEALMFSMWPQGIKELAFGERRYVTLTGSYVQE